VLPPPGEEQYAVPKVSDDTRELVDREVRRITEACYERARRALAENRDKLESLTQALLEHETLDEDDAYRAAGIDRSETPEPAPAEAGVVVDSTATEEPAPARGSGASELPGG